MWFGTDANNAEQFVLGLLGWMLAGLDDNGRTLALDALRSTIAAHDTPDGVIFDSAVWVIRATPPVVTALNDRALGDTDRHLITSSLRSMDQ